MAGELGSPGLKFNWSCKMTNAGREQSATAIPKINCVE